MCHPRALFDFPSSSLWVILLVLLAVLPTTQVVVGILYKRTCDEKSSSSAILWNLVSGVLMLVALVMEIAYSCTMRIVLSTRKVSDGGVSGAGDGGGPGMEGGNSSQRLALRARRVVYYPLMVVVFAIALAVSAALGIYVMLTSSCCEFVDTFTAVSVYSHLIGVLVGPAFCCVSFSWFRSEDDATTQSCSDESPDNDGMSTLNSVGLRGSTHIYEITSLRRDGCVGGMAGGRAGGGGVGRKQSTGAIGGLNSKNVLFGPSNALTNPQGNSIRNGRSRSMYFASFEGEQGNPHQFHPQHLHHPHTGPVGVGGGGGNMTDLNGPMAAINPNYNPDFFWPPLSHHHHVPMGNDPRLMDPAFMSNTSEVKRRTTVHNRGNRGSHYENIDSRMAHLGASKDVVGGVSINPPASHVVMGEHRRGGGSRGSYDEQMMNGEHYLSPLQLDLMPPGLTTDPQQRSASANNAPFSSLAYEVPTRMEPIKITVPHTTSTFLPNDESSSIPGDSASAVTGVSDQGQDTSSEITERGDGGEGVGSMARRLKSFGVEESKDNSHVLDSRDTLLSTDTVTTTDTIERQSDV